MSANGTRAFAERCSYCGVDLALCAPGAPCYSAPPVDEFTAMRRFVACTASRSACVVVAR
jgi:hypothetical protein